MEPTIIYALFIFMIAITFVYFTIFHQEKKKTTISGRLRDVVKREDEQQQCKMRIVKKTKDLLSWYEIQGNRFGWSSMDEIRYPNLESARRKLEEYKERYQKPEQEVIYETDVDGFTDHTEDQNNGPHSEF